MVEVKKILKYQHAKNWYPELPKYIKINYVGAITEVSWCQFHQIYMCVIACSTAANFVCSMLMERKSFYQAQSHNLCEFISAEL